MQTNQAAPESVLKYIAKCNRNDDRKKAGLRINRSQEWKLRGIAMDEHRGHSGILTQEEINKFEAFVSTVKDSQK